SKNDYREIIDAELESITQALGGGFKQWWHLHFGGPTRDIKDLMGWYIDESDNNNEVNYNGTWSTTMLKEYKLLLSEDERMHRIKNLFDSLRIRLPRITTGARKYNRYDPVNNLETSNGREGLQRLDDE